MDKCVFHDTLSEIVKLFLNRESKKSCDEGSCVVAVICGATWGVWYFQCVGVSVSQWELCGVAVGGAVLWCVAAVLGVCARRVCMCRRPVTATSC